MSSTMRQRFFLEKDENRVGKPFKGEVHMLAVGLDYKGTNEPLTCTPDTERLTKLAKASGVRDMIKMYDTGSTPKFPSPQELKNEIQAFAARCKPDDYFVFQYSGHGERRKNKDARDGSEMVLCLRTLDDNAADMPDSDLVHVISESFHPDVHVLVLADACQSAGVLSHCNTPAVWGGGRKVPAISGCQDTQSSIDTDDGGEMTNALLKVLNRKKVRAMRKRRGVSVQYIVNRMVEFMPDEDSEDDSHSDYSSDESEDGDTSDEDEYRNEEVDSNDEDEEDGQNINLSWPGGCDPSKMIFPF